MRLWLLLGLMSLIPVFANTAMAAPPDCSLLGGWKHAECLLIASDSSLSQAEKTDLYLNLLVSQDELPPYGEIWVWNTSLSFNQPPDGVVPESERTIQGAWAKVIAVEMSVLDVDENEWLVAPDGGVLSAYGFSISFPSAPEPDDCLTEYETLESGSWFGVYVNGGGIGSDRIAYYAGLQGGEEAVFGTALDVWHSYLVDHHKWKLECRKGTLEDCDWVCKYLYSEEREDSLSVSDSFETRVHSPNPGFEIIVEEGNGLDRLSYSLQSAEPVNYAELLMGENSYRSSGLNFDVASRLEPYTVLYPTRKQAFSKTQDGFIELSFEKQGNGFTASLLSEKSNGCSVRLVTDFEDSLLNCGLERLEPTEIALSTDKNFFDVNEMVEAKARLTNSDGLALSNKRIELQAGNQKTEAVTNSQGDAKAEFSAADSRDLITAKFDSDSEFKGSEGAARIGVADSSNTTTGAEVLSFFGLYYLIFLFVKRKLGVFM